MPVEPQPCQFCLLADTAKCSCAPHEDCEYCEVLPGTVLVSLAGVWTPLCPGHAVEWRVYCDLQRQRARDAALAAVPRIH